MDIIAAEVPLRQHNMKLILVTMQPRDLQTRLIVLQERTI